MAKTAYRFASNLEEAVTYFRPILQRLSIRQEPAIGSPVLLASFPHLWPLDDLKNWVITVMKTRLVGSRAKFMSQYHKETRVMECFIILDTVFFVDAKVPNELRKAVAVHEFCHFLALLYASISTTEERLMEKLRERLSKTIDELTNEQVMGLYQFISKMRPSGDDFSNFEQTKDDHFRLNCEDLDLSYSDLFRNFLLSHQMFNEFFGKDDRDRFFSLLKTGKYREALDLYLGIAKTIAREKWIPENFAINQAIDILKKFYLNEIK